MTNNALSELKPILQVIRLDSPQAVQQRDLRQEEFLNKGHVQEFIKAAAAGNWQTHATLGYKGQSLLISMPGQIKMLRRFIDILIAYPEQISAAYNEEIPYENMLRYARLRALHWKCLWSNSKNSPER